MANAHAAQHLQKLFVSAEEYVIAADSCPLFCKRG